MPRTDTPTPITNASIVRGFEALSVTKDEEEWVRALVARRLEHDRAGLMDCLGRIAKSVAIATESKEMHAWIRPVFQAIEDEARAALAQAREPI